MGQAVREKLFDGGHFRAPALAKIGL